VLIDLATTLNFVSQDFLKRSNLFGKYIRGPKIDVHIANEQRISASKNISPTHVSLGQKQFTSLIFTLLPHLKFVDFIFGLPSMKELNMSIQPSAKDLVPTGGIPFSCESQSRRISCLVVDSS
jgi:hypothetical protein